MNNIRKIIHVDMDAFYASIEQRDNPRLRGKPVVVGGDPRSRGVVCTCSYEARKYGIHSAMPAAQAYRLCPQAAFIEPRMEVYELVSAQVRTVFFFYTDLVEPLSLDEAYLDVTVNKKNMPSATYLARDILADIRKETGLTASAGVSFNKFLAKTASDMHKPNGLTVITPEEADVFIAALPIEKFFGIGKVTALKMRRMGITCGAELRQLELVDLIKNFGKSGIYYYNIARGCDSRSIEPHRERKSFGREITLRQDTGDPVQMMDILSMQAAEVETMLRNRNVKGRTVTLKLKYDDFTGITRSQSFAVPFDDRKTMIEAAAKLLEKTEAGKRKVRLLGIAVSNFPGESEEPGHPVQLELPF